MLVDRAFALLLARDVKANVVLFVGPVDANEGGKRRRRFVHVKSSRMMGKAGHAKPDPAKSIW